MNPPAASMHCIWMEFNHNKLSTIALASLSISIFIVPDVDFLMENVQKNLLVLNYSATMLISSSQTGING